MSWLRLLVLALIAHLASAGPADAGPLAAAIGALVSSVGAAWTALGAGVFGAALQQTVLGLALWAISGMFRKTPPPPGVRRRVDFGGDKPQRVMLGHFASAGHLIWSGSHGQEGRSPNAYYQDVILLSVLRVKGLTGVLINGARVELGETAHPDFGLPVLDYHENGTDYLWIKFYNGSQTAADAMLVDRYGEDEEFAWTADMIGRGCAYAILTARGNQELFGGQVPQAIFEIDGVRLYDLRYDSTMGGAGPQRLDDPSTWAFSANPMVAAYTLLTAGLSYGNAALYGPRWPRHMLPAANWLAAINASDVTAEGQDGEDEPIYRFGADLDLSTEPRDFLRELFKCCAADSALCEGQFLVHVGAASAPVAHIIDADCSVSHAQELDPFKGFEEVFNAAAATFPDPAQSWAMVPAPARYRPEWEAVDGGRRVAPMPFAYVPWVSQVQRLAEAALLDQRRQRVHRLVLHHRFGFLAPLDYIAWSSGRNNYSAKLFKIVTIHDHRNGYVELLLIEEDPDDYDPPQLLPHQPVPVNRYVIASQAVPGWSLTPHTVLDADSRARRPALRASWDASAIEGVRFLRIRLRLAGDEGEGRTLTADATRGELFIDSAILPATAYQASARLIVDRPTEWTSWLTAVTPDVRLGPDDLDEDLWSWIADLFADAGLQPPLMVNVLPATGEEDELVWLRSESRLYRWDGSAWVTLEIAPEDLTGKVELSAFAQGIRPVEIVEELPASGNAEGRTVVLTTDGKLYRYHDGDWTAAVAAGDVAGQITANQIAANAVTAGKIAAGAVSASEIAAGAIVASRLAVGDITNLVGTADMTDEDYWSQPAGVSFQNGGGAWQSARLVRLQGDGAAYVVSVGQTFEVEPGSSLYLSYNARIVSGTGSVFVDVQTSASADFSSSSFLNVGTVTSTSITNRAGTITVPAGHRYARVRLIKGNNGSTDCFIGKVVCRVAAGGELIVDGAITAGKIAAGTITGDRLVAGTITGGLLAASGIITSAAQIGNAVVTNAKIANAAVTNAKISGAIQSDNFSSGSAGWQINKNGNAQFNNLIVRGSLVVGAVSDIEQQYLSSEYRWTNDTWTTRVTITLGAVDPTDLWQMHFTAQMRRLFAQHDGWSEWLNAEIRVQRRVQISGTWQSWVEIAYHNNNWSTSWQHYNESEVISGDFTSVQYRVQQKVQWNGAPSGNNYRRIALSARKITR